MDAANVRASWRAYTVCFPQIYHGIYGIISRITRKNIGKCSKLFVNDGTEQEIFLFPFRPVNFYTLGIPPRYFYRNSVAVPFMFCMWEALPFPFPFRSDLDNGIIAVPSHPIPCSLAKP